VSEKLAHPVSLALFFYLPALLYMSDSTMHHVCWLGYGFKKHLQKEFDV
jgi:hypothetical protein